MTRHKVGRKSKSSSGNPEYRLHKRTGQAVVTLPLGNGQRKDVYLGKHGSEESKAEYNRVLAEWAANGKQAPIDPLAEPASDLTIDELVSRFIDHANVFYRDATGAPTTEYDNFKLSLHPLRLLFGPLSVSKFGPVALEQVRDFMVREGSGKKGFGKNGSSLCGRGLCRRVINQRMGRIKRFFRWAASKELIPHTVYQRLATIEGLREDRSPARESKDVRPVPPEIVDATLPHLLRPVAAMVRVQQLTGARPGEVCVMRSCDIDRSGPVWVYRPGSDEGPRGKHKTAYRGHLRAIPLGPQSQEIIKPFLLNRDPGAYLFSPREGMAEFRAWQRSNRKSKVQPSQVDRSKARPKKRFGEHYNHRTYGKAIKAVCKRHGIPPWHPHQLRHYRATEIRRLYGVEKAQVILGHASLKATEIYAETNLADAMEIAAQMG
ncbi:MAG: tyrosine-type recombinase/integrase [Gemmataceae bacterium]